MPKKETTEVPQTQGVEVEKAEPVVLETVKIVGPCGEDNPCGGGFGTD